MENKEIKIGRSTFSESVLKKLTLKNAEDKFHYLDKRIVLQAWEIANPGVKESPKSKKKSKKKPLIQEEDLPKEEEKSEEENED